MHYAIRFEKNKSAQTHAQNKVIIMRGGVKKRCGAHRIHRNQARKMFKYTKGF
jgi:hypothetical protein